MLRPDDIAREHEGLVHEIARRIDRELGVADLRADLVQLGFVGLLEAGRGFDPDKGNPFATFAHYRVSGAIWDGVRKMQHVPASAHRYARAAAAREAAAEEALATRTERGPEIELDPLGARLEGLMGRVTGAILIAELDAAPATPEEELIRATEIDRLRRAFLALAEPYQTVIRAYYFEDRSLDDISVLIDSKSRSTTSRYHTAALGMLRDALG